MPAVWQLGAAESPPGTRACVAGLDDALAQLVVFAYESGLVSPGHAG